MRLWWQSQWGHASHPAIPPTRLSLLSVQLKSESSTPCRMRESWATLLAPNPTSPALHAFHHCTRTYEYVVRRSTKPEVQPGDIRFRRRGVVSIICIRFLRHPAPHPTEPDERGPVQRGCDDGCEHRGIARGAQAHRSRLRRRSINPAKVANIRTLAPAPPPSQNTRRGSRRNMLFARVMCVACPSRPTTLPRTPRRLLHALALAHPHAGAPTICTACDRA